MSCTCGYTERLQQEDLKFKRSLIILGDPSHKTPRTWDVLSGRMFFNHLQGPELDPYPLEREEGMEGGVSFKKS